MLLSSLLGTTSCGRAPQATETIELRPTEARPTEDQGNPTKTPGQDPAVAVSSTKSPLTTPLEDRGIFDDLNHRIETQCPYWTAAGPHLRVRFEDAHTSWLAVDGFVACAAPEGAPSDDGAFSATFPASSRTAMDRDGDGIVDAVDILRGAKKVVTNGAAYGSGYQELAYPGGDVPREEGVCTDVLVRSLRNAGFDLQELLSEDIAKHPRRYPMVKKPDPNIDHRRVRTLLPYFQAHFTERAADPNDTRDPYLPGDICFMDTLGGPEPEHVGIVSDRLGPSGFPLIINNWTDGWRTQEMDLLGRVRVTHRFRVAPRLTGAPAEHAGLQGLLARRAIAPPNTARQLLLVVTPLWNSSGGELSRYERAGANDPWREVGTPLPVRIGSKGLGRGIGLHDGRAVRGAPDKREGDRRAPAGLFALGTAFGRAPKAPFAPGRWPYRATTAKDRFVDDPASPHYNTWQVEPAAKSLPWSSAERLTMYSLGLVVEHNTQFPVPGAGSAIFMHPWKGPTHPTVGCTALPEGQLIDVLRWLDPKAQPVLVQVAGTKL